jgi:hypothetical protein
MFMRALLFAWSFLAAMGIAAWARAQEQELPAVLRVPEQDPRRGPRLEYMPGPAQCPDEKTFRREVAYWVDGRDHLAAASPDVVRVQLAWTPDGYVGTVTYTDAAGQSNVVTVTRDGGHCPMLARWVALKVSKHIPPKPPPPPCPVCQSCPVCTECAACPRCASPAPPPRCPPERRSWFMDLTIGLNAYGMMTWLLTPNVAPAVGVGVDVRGEIFSFGAEVRVVLPSGALATEKIPDKPSYYPVQFDLSQFTGLLVPCGRWKYLVGCALVQAGWIRWKTAVWEGTSPTWGLGARLGFEVPFAERFAVFGFGELLFAPDTPGVQFTDPPPKQPEADRANVRWEQPLASGFFAAGLQVHFK